ncbi:MAG: diiron oxygenase [Gordonia sp. (in: high G+C Gram-positive bacteria)]|uniref:diiron oxygenase n=1 Tax=Gordonia sp. (in: high G+C Gram-positive bacteria) TaxID=84139 RepID=UPI0039E439D6
MGTEFFEPTTTDGGPVSRRRSIVDRQATAQRFLFEAAEDSYNGELDIAWDAPPIDGLPWLPPTMVTLHGTEQWTALSPVERDDLSRRELVDLLTLAVYAETVLSMLTFRDVAERSGIADDRARWMLKCVDTHARNITMFGRLVDLTGLPAYRRKKLARRLEKYTLLVPNGATTGAVTLMLEGALAGLMRMAGDGEVQPHVAQITQIHLIASRRHLRFAREDLVERLAGRGPVRRAAASVAGAGVVTAVGRLMINPDVYRDMGLPVPRAVRAARTSDAHRHRMDAAFTDTVRFAAEAGLFRDPMSRSMLRRAGFRRPRS